MYALSMDLLLMVTAGHIIYDNICFCFTDDQSWQPWGHTKDFDALDAKT